MLHRLHRPTGDSRNEMIWLTVYADLITNLALVFLALYGLTIMGDEALIQALQSMKFGHIEEITHSDEKLNFDDIQTLLKKEFVQSPDITISGQAGLARIEFGEGVLFESGRADLKEAGIPLLERVATLLQIVPYTVIVEGHTDDVPLSSGSKFKDNRELSLARAMSVVNLFVKEGSLDAGQLAAAAYGSYRPRASNLTTAGRRMNRRVEIVFVKDFPYTYKSEGVKP